MDLTYVIVGVIVALVVAAIFLFGGVRGDTKVVLGAPEGNTDAATNRGGFET